MFNTILVPLDGSDNAYRALALAANLAKPFDSQIDVLSVFRHHSYIEASISMVRPRDPEHLDDVLSAYAKAVVEKGKTILRQQGVEKVKGFIKMGAPSKKNLEFAQEHQIDPIVISAKGRGDLTGYLLGGVSHKVAGLAHCPVMVI